MDFGLASRRLLHEIYAAPNLENNLFYELIYGLKPFVS